MAARILLTIALIFTSLGCDDSNETDTLPEVGSTSDNHGQVGGGSERTSGSEGAAEGQTDAPTSNCEDVCTLGATQCGGEGNTPETCETDPNTGCTTWVSGFPCAAVKVCSGGQCITQATPFDFAGTAPWYGCGAIPDDPAVVRVDTFIQADQFFGSDNLRNIETEVNFPEVGDWAQVGMRFHLECPENGLCDHWDRSGSVQLITNPEAPAEEQEKVELLRHITPYKIPMCQYVDVTEVASLLNGKKKLSSWIDTWVGPGHAQGEGWRVSVSFFFYPGQRNTADEVINIWGRRSITVGEIEPDVNVESQIAPTSFTIPSDAKQVLAHLVTTGHSFGNTLNCAEFCEMRHDIVIDGAIVESINPWRQDCPQNPVSPQYGTWEYPRNGWCPGAVALGDIVDITAAVTPGQTHEVDLNVLLSNGQEYDNVSPVDLLPYEYVSLKLYVFK